MANVRYVAVYMFKLKVIITTAVVPLNNIVRSDNEFQYAHLLIRVIYMLSSLLYKCEDVEKLALLYLLHCVSSDVFLRGIRCNSIALVLSKLYV